MSKQDLISNIETERDRLEETIAALAPEQITEANTLGTWSVKDVLAHLTVWASRCVTIVFNAEQGQEPEDIDAMFDRYDALNAEDYELLKDRPLDLIQADFRGVHKQLIRRLTPWSETHLNDRVRFPWLRGSSMSEYLQSNLVGHEEDHRQLIERLRK